MSDLTEKDVLDVVLRSDFRTFALKAFETVYAGTEYQAALYLDGLIYECERILAGETRRLIVSLCPRTMKSFFISVCLPAFILGKAPNKQILVVSHSEQLALPLAGQFRKIVQSSWYRKAFPKMKAAPSKDTEREFITTENGYRLAISAEGSVTGLGADFIILDDVLDARDALNAEACRKRGEWIVRALFSRLNDKETSTVIVVMQRLSIWDPVAFLLARGKWRTFSLPVLADRDYKIETGDNECQTLKAGEYLTPRVGPAALQEIKTTHDAADFAAQYMQNPVPVGGGGIDLSLFKRFDEVPHPREFSFLSVDTATGSPTGDFCVIQLWHAVDGRLYLDGQARGKFSIVKLKDIVMKALEDYKPKFVVIEKASVGPALYSMLYKELGHERAYGLLKGWTPRGAKDIRLARASIMIEQGKVFLPKDRNWIDGFVSELQAFPEGPHDDQVDAMTQAIEFFMAWIKGPPQVRVTSISVPRRSSLIRNAYF